MKKIIIAMDSFKETMSNFEVSTIVYNNLTTRYIDKNFILMPIADGGEGSVQALCAATGAVAEEFVSVDANFENIKVLYGKMLDNTYIIEVAYNIGYNCRRAYSTPANTSSYGVGELIKHILGFKPQKIYLCLGGTITNDAGVGLASALGVKFYNQYNKEFIPCGDSLHKIKKIDNRYIDKRLKNVSIYGLSDVNNPLYGLTGASYVFARQKGADDLMIEHLDKGLRHLDEIVKRDFNMDLSVVPGAGAAGGIGYGLMVFLNGKLTSGIETILNLYNFDEMLKETELVITGEGKLDRQSIDGKAISGILQFTNRHNVKTIAIVGTMEENLEYYQPYGLQEIYECNYKHLPFSEVKKIYKEQLIAAVEKIKI